VRRDVFTELLVNFLNDFGAPAANLIVNQVHFAAKFVSRFLILRLNDDLLIKGLNLR
jgi:hypothetical protein